MRISILTMFPELFGSYLLSPIPKRAADRGIAEIRLIDIKDYSGGSFRHIDDDTYGGGAGAVLRAKPVLAALQAAQAGDHSGRRVTAALTPVGRPYDQQTAERYCHLDHLILICGHYEGMDERIYHHVDERISIGDYILSGGELASQVVMDSILRLLPGVLRPASTADESFTAPVPTQDEGSLRDAGLLEYPQYTRPADLDGDRVPSVLLSGDHEAIRIWRLKESLRATLRWRPDLLARHPLSEEERRLLAEIEEEQNEQETATPTA